MSVLPKKRIYTDANRPGNTDYRTLIFNAQTSILCTLYVYVFDYEDYDMNRVRDLTATTKYAIHRLSNVDRPQHLSTST